jgi:hypothetical protein
MAIFYLLPNGKHVVLKPGEEVRIQWPDDTVDTVTLQCRPNHTTVDDMGHRYPVIQNFFGFTTQLHGTEVWVDIASVKINSDDLKNM